MGGMGGMGGYGMGGMNGMMGKDGPDFLDSCFMNIERLNFQVYQFLLLRFQAKQACLLFLRSFS